MINDQFLTFAEAVGIDAATGDHNLGDVIDLQALGGLEGALGNARDIGIGAGVNHPLYLVILITEDVDSAADGASVSFELVSDAQAAITEDDTETSHVVSAVFPEADLTEGTRIVIPLPVEQTYERFLGVQFNVSGEATTAGAATAFLTMQPGFYTSHPQGDVAG